MLFSQANTYAGVEDEFNISPLIATLGLSLFVLGLGFAPLVLGPLSEFYGRNPIVSPSLSPSSPALTLLLLQYRISYFFFIIWNLMVAFSNNAGTSIALLQSPSAHPSPQPHSSSVAS